MEKLLEIRDYLIKEYPEDTSSLVGREGVDLLSQLNDVFIYKILSMQNYEEYLSYNDGILNIFNSISNSEGLYLVDLVNKDDVYKLLVVSKLKIGGIIDCDEDTKYYITELGEMCKYVFELSKDIK